MGTQERCRVCDDLTGNAGRGDGSLYLDSGFGPLCGECFQPDRIEELEAANAKLREERDALGALGRHKDGEITRLLEAHARLRAALAEVRAKALFQSSRYALDVLQICDTALGGKEGE